MLKTSIFPALVAFMFIIQGCSSDKTQASEDANSIIATNKYVLTSLKNKQYTVTKEVNNFLLEGAEGKVVIFDIFATWCPPCQASAAHLSSLQQKYKDDLIVIGATVEDNIANAKLQEFAKKYHATYTIVNSAENRRFVDAVASSLRLGDRFPIPILAMYKDGVLINHYVGAIQEEFVESDIKKALGK